MDFQYFTSSSSFDFLGDRIVDLQPQNAYDANNNKIKISIDYQNEKIKDLYSYKEKFPVKIVGTIGDDTIAGTIDSEIIIGDNGDDLLSGKSGNDTLKGEIGNDVLFGDNGDDLLIGGAGSDFLIGGKGADRFQFDNFAKLEIDIIKDFNSLEGDKIEINSLKFGATALNEFSFDPTTGGLFFKQLQIATLDNIFTLNIATDIVLI